MNGFLPGTRGIGLPFHLREPTETTRATVPLDAPRLAAFDALVHEINPDAPRVDAARVQRLANWLVARPVDEVQALLAHSLQRVENLRAMLDDSDWPVEPGLRARATRLVRHVDGGEPLVDTHDAQLRRLGDALLVDLCWPEFREVVEEFLDYRADREETGAVSAPFDLLAWRDERRVQAALWHHRQQATWGHYAPVSQPPSRFVVD